MFVCEQKGEMTSGNSLHEINPIHFMITKVWVLRERLTEPTSVDDAVDVCPGNDKMLGHALGCSPELHCIYLAGKFSWPRRNCAKHR